MPVESSNKILGWLVTILTGVLLTTGGWFFGNISRSNELAVLKDTAILNKTTNQIQDVQIQEIKNALTEIKQGVIDMNRKIDMQNNRNMRTQ